MLPGAHLATLKWYRNQLAHATVTSLDKNEFADKWVCVEKVYYLEAEIIQHKEKNKYFTKFLYSLSDILMMYSHS